MYCHIAGRFETDFDKVLKSEGDTSSSKSIQRFEKLFSEYQAIKRKLKTLRFTRSHLQSEIASIQKLGKIANVSSDELKLLHSYFPNVNIEKIENVQSFHFLPKAQKTNFHCNRRSRQIQRDF